MRFRVGAVPRRSRSVSGDLLNPSAHGRVERATSNLGSQGDGLAAYRASSPNHTSKAVSLTVAPTLPNKPLVEALLEIRWELQKLPASPGPVDPGYPFAVGRLFELVRERYPFREELPVAQVPDALTPHVAKHRFRVSEDAWPLVQIGPGVASVNFTEGYTWEVFREAALEFVPQLASAYEGVYPLKPVSVLLRYINAVEFDYGRGDVLEFFREKLHTSFQLPEGITGFEHRSGFPEGLSFQLALPVGRPPGAAITRFSTGKRGEAPAVVWEHHVLSKKEGAPGLAEGFREWLEQAHEVAERWFFTLVEGDLLAAFKEERTHA